VESVDKRDLNAVECTGGTNELLDERGTIKKYYALHIATSLNAAVGFSTE